MRPSGLLVSVIWPLLVCFSSRSCLFPQYCSTWSSLTTYRTPVRSRGRSFVSWGIRVRHPRQPRSLFFLCTFSSPPAQNLPLALEARTNATGWTPTSLTRDSTTFLLFPPGGDFHISHTSPARTSWTPTMSSTATSTTLRCMSSPRKRKSSRHTHTRNPKRKCKRQCN